MKVLPRKGQEIRMGALFPQQEKYDDVDHTQTPPGFNLIFLPYADDIANLIGTKHIVEPSTISTELVAEAKALIRSMTIHDFDLRNFENPALQKFYNHLQAHALNEKEVE